MAWSAPVVDMKDASAPTVVSEACRNFGVFYLENHDIPDDVIARVFAQSKAFFALSVEEKMAVKADKNNRGYMRMHEEILDPKNQSKGDTKEGYHIFREIDADSDEAGEVLRGPNQWPSENLVPGWKETMKDYFDRMHALGVRLTTLLATGLGLDPSFFERCLTDSMAALRLLRYSTEVSDPERGVFGTGAHSDYGLLTILATDNVPGLQIQLDGQWFDAPPRPGAFVCNVGDLLQRWTNDHLRSPVHRVVKKLGCERYSIPFFLEPNFDTEVVCLPQFCSDEKAAKHPPVKSGLFLLDKYTQSHTDFPGDSIKH